MEAIIPWLTPALIVALGAWLRADMRAQGAETNRRIDETKQADRRPPAGAQHPAHQPDRGPPAGARGPDRRAEQAYRQRAAGRSAAGVVRH